MEPSIRSLASDYPDLTFRTVPMDGPIQDHYLEAEILWMSALSDEIFDEILAKNRSLQWVQLTAAGFDWILRDGLTARLENGLRATRSGHSFDTPIAEFVLASMFYHARKFPELVHAQRARQWTRPEADEIGGSTVAIVGTGSIGQEVAWRAKAMGSTVLGVNRTGTPAQGFDRVVPQSELKTLLPVTDYLVIAAPLTHETRHMIGTAEFDAMKNTAVLINVGRGEIVETRSLQDALRSGAISAAVVDVFEEEPLPSEHELWDVPNLFVTPHTSFRASGNLRRLETEFRLNLERYLKGETLAGEMKAPQLGY
ncbi:D-2-hydroxyacid dehydrogenase [Nonlabens tegetincola]